MCVTEIVNHILQIEHGFKHINEGADKIIETLSKEHCYQLAIKMFDHEAYQVRMLATTLLGTLACNNGNALKLLKEKVACDNNWRVQEMLAKAFDKICKMKGYEQSLPLIEEWLNNSNPNVCRAVTEGLRIWTNRPFFNDNPSIAISLISRHKGHQSDYLRKSVGNALCDISKKHLELVRKETAQWDLSNPSILFTYKLAMKHCKQT